MARRRSKQDASGASGSSPDPFAVLRLPADADEQAIVDARRRLAKRAHPDAGGSVEAMQRLNDAVDAALRHARTVGSTGVSSTPTSGSTRAQRPPGRRPVPRPARRDHPSFTIEVLPVEAYEALLVVATWFGEVIHDDPPYLLETALVDPIRGWCRLELVPDAGASTVSLTVAAEPGYPVPDVDEVRDLWIDGLNRLDWDDPAGRPLP